MPPVYVFGHINPDTDSICSAIAYAELKNLVGSGYFPARLGQVNRETRFVLQQFDVEEPDLLQHVYLRAQDVMQTGVISGPPDCSLYDVKGDLLIVGDREDAQAVALQQGVSCLIITGGFVPSSHVQQP